MKLCSIINAWECTAELLPQAVNNHMKFSDGVILVVSKLSNRMQQCTQDWLYLIQEYYDHPNVFVAVCEPEKGLHVAVNETRKRNFGIQKAREIGYTHFFLSDADEFYNAEEADKAKLMFHNDPTLNGIVAKTRVYIKKPTLWCEDHTLVSFIHKLKPETYTGSFKEYPFAYDKQGNAHIDPTRRINEYRGVAMSDVTMRHYSYVRKNIDLKIANSSANLTRSEKFIKEDLANAKPGYVMTFSYQKALQECENEFNIAI